MAEGPGDEELGQEDLGDGGGGVDAGVGEVGGVGLGLVGRKSEAGGLSLDAGNQPRQGIEGNLEQLVADQEGEQGDCEGHHGPGQQQLHAAGAQCLDELVTSPGADPGKEQEQTDLAEGEIGADGDDPGDAPGAFESAQQQGH